MTSERSRDARLPVDEYLPAAFARAKFARFQAEALMAAGFYDPALVWAVRASEILVRDFVLTPYYLMQGDPLPKAMRLAGKVLGESSWARAFARAEEWFGPFDEPTTQGGGSAWEYWKGTIVRRRGDIVHGRFTTPADAEEAQTALAFAERMSSWFAQRFLTTQRHPMGQKFYDQLTALSATVDADESDRT